MGGCSSIIIPIVLLNFFFLTKKETEGGETGEKMLLPVKTSWKKVQTPADYREEINFSASCTQKGQE